MYNTPFHLTGKTVLVTGASDGIGAKCAISISEMGGKVLITGRNEERLNDTFSKLKGEGHSIFIADLTDDEEVKKLAEVAPQLDGLVHCAGIISPLPVKYINRVKVNEMFDINFTSAVLLMAMLLRQKKINSGASIVFMSSFAGTYPHRGGALYAASKAALEKYCMVLAAEYASSGIRANCISPGLVNTKLLEKASINDTDFYNNKGIEKKYLLGIGETEDVANLALYLLSPGSKQLTGQNIILDSGLLLGLIS